LPMRSQKAPPSRVLPAFSISLPYGLVISVAAGLPPYH
jgi:hypothetical protein